MNPIVAIPRTHDSTCGKFTTDSIVNEISIEPTTKIHQVKIFELLISRLLRTDSWYDNPHAMENSTLNSMNIIIPSIKLRWNPIIMAAKAHNP